MPRYFFHVHDGHSFPDEVGTELPSLGAARREAVRLAGTLLRDDKGEFWNGDDWHVDVTDAASLILFSLHFMAVDAPAITVPPRAANGAGKAS